MRWAETTRTSCGTPSDSSTSTACCIVSQSETRPHDDPDQRIGHFDSDPEYGGEFEGERQRANTVTGQRTRVKFGNSTSA